MRLWLYRLCGLAPILTLIASLAWILSTNPFVTPMIERGEADLKKTLDRAMARTVDPEWLNARLIAALAEEDLDRAALLIEIGAEQSPPVRPTPQLLAQFSSQAEVANSFLSQVGACASCALNAASCKSIAQISACLIPLELTPIGDLNALRSEGWKAMTGDEMDKLNVGLAVFGLGATVLVVSTGPVSATAKVGATALRVARNLGTVTARFGRELATFARLDIKVRPLMRWAVGRGPLDEALDMARLNRLGEVSDSLTSVARNTSAAETLVLLRHVDSADDAARLARVAASAGPDTRKYFTALGKNRVFRALVRISDEAFAAAMAIYALTLNILVALAQFVGGRALRLLCGALRPA